MPLIQHAPPQAEQASFRQVIVGVQPPKDGGKDGGGAVGVTAAEAAEVALTP